ncbi:hypothetical protein WAI453_007165 [Rhynchosporium graminicola]
MSFRETMCRGWKTTYQKASKRELNAQEQEQRKLKLPKKFESHSTNPQFAGKRQRMLENSLKALEIIDSEGRCRGGAEVIQLLHLLLSELLVFGLETANPISRPPQL